MSTQNPNPPQEPRTKTPSLAEGQKLAGCYALHRKLSSNNSIEVWLATDEVLGKDVTLHVIPAAIRKDGRAIQELRLDIKRNRQLIHPNILRVYDLVEDPAQVAISMDVFEAESITEKIQGGKALKSVEVQGWAEQLAKTLEEAHKINVFHRDLNPGNILLTGAGKLIVTNFGIGRTIRDAQARVAGGASAVSGYESPQVLEGKPGARTDDVYSFGAVLFAAVAGQPVFAGDKIGEQVAAGVPAATLEKLGEGVPASWKDAISACLAKNPEDRPQSVAEAFRRLTTAGDQPAAPAPAIAPAPVEAAVAAAMPVIAAAKVAEPEPVLEEKAEAAKSEPASPEPERAEDKPIQLAVAKDEPVETIPSAESEQIVEAEASAPLKLETPQPKPSESKPFIYEPLESAPEPSIEVIPTPRLEAESPKASEPSVVEPNSKGAQPEPEVAKEPEAVQPYTPPAETAAKPFERQLSKEFVPKLYPEESRFPTKPLIAAAVLLVGAVVYYSVKKPAQDSSEQVPEQKELRALSTPAASPTPADSVKPSVASATPAATPTVQTSLPPSATPAPQVPAGDLAGLEKAKAAAQAAEQQYAALLKQKETVEAEVAEIKKTVEEKSKAVEPLKKAADETMAQRKKLEEEQKAAEAAAAEAQKVAAEKSQAAEKAKKTLDELEKSNAEKLAAQQNAEAAIAAMQKTLAEKQQAAADSAKALSEAQAAKEQKLAAVAAQESEMAKAKTAGAEAQKKQEAEEAERKRVERELADMKKAFSDRMKELEDKRKVLENPVAPVADAKLPEKAPAIPPAIAPPAATPEPTKMASLPATPAPLATSTPAPAVVPGGNSLGMKFVPIGDVDFAIWQTRVKDFEVFAKAVNLRSTSWKGPGFKQGPDHPVVNVSWQEAIAFCKWLTDKEHKEGTLPANQYYRLPTDLEWSKAVGLGEESGKTPEARDMGVQDVYPWGTQWPPPPGAGNYTGEETGSDVAIKGYDDGFAWTSPVGSFPPNKFGLYDMGGNVWQWCMDSWTADSKAKVLRGASWYNGALKLSLLSSCRVHAAPDSSTDNYGFRIVRATESAKPARK